MIRIVATTRDGTRSELSADSGLSLMEVLRDRDLDVEGVCGGAVSCASCHVYVADEWVDKLSAPDEMEEALVGDLVHAKPNSRLCCQIVLSDKFDGLEVTVAPSEM
ncbi:2Fe-2S iron-sulfur cluster-binding protein [Hirschia baltica]|uniref:Ferredoxin n=1 Tax=Hirschia baltica (strain ATCC 49814 / DSM 5838 / IFAM 1418) TaxID=582402 RepID=C6XNW8_HIRBI|nr:2Fe-2S iron-sulfur cluster-binding protein [Hirschia baltica]ACT60148.1 ferredoxin [Hirschia baltica ATCC 49814]